LIRDNPEQALEAWLHVAERRQAVAFEDWRKPGLDNDEAGDDLVEIGFRIEAMHYPV
jgi:hypothetical protein